MNSQITFQSLSIQTRWLCFFLDDVKTQAKSPSSSIILVIEKKIVVTWNLLIFFYLLVLLMKRKTANNFFLSKYHWKSPGLNDNNVQIFSPPKNVSTFLKKNWATLQRGVLCQEVVLYEVLWLENFQCKKKHFSSENYHFMTQS